MLLNLCGEILIVRATSFYLDLLDIVVRRPSSVWTPLDIVDSSILNFQFFLFGSFGAVRAGTFYIFF